MSISVKYFIPEDGDDERFPNLFTFGGSGSSVTLNQVRSAFPVPGRYHFRYLRKLGSTTVWMDAVDESDSIPVLNSTLFLKVSRVSFPCSGANMRPASVASSSTSTHKNTEVSMASTSVPAIDLVGFADFDSVEATGGSVTSGGSSQGQQSVDNLAEKSNSDSDLLGAFDSSIPTGTTTSSSGSNLFGLEGLSVTASPAPMGNGLGGPMGVNPMGGGMGGAPMGGPMGGGMMGGGSMQQPQQGMLSMQGNMGMGMPYGKGGGKKDAFSGFSSSALGDKK
jgi:hypothetical protein